MFDKIIIAMMSAGIGASLAFVIQYYRAALSEDLVLLNDHIKDLEKFGEQSAQYWTSSFNNFTENQTAASRVMAYHYSCFHLYDQIIENCDERSDKYNELSQRLTSLATGGNFNSDKHSPEPERLSDIVETLSELIHTLRISRSYIISPKRTLKRVGKCLAASWHAFANPNRPWLDEEDR